MNKTINYYEQNAESFSKETAHVAFGSVQDRFLALIPAGGKILDFGCGVGRDAKYFHGQGYEVEAIDGSESMCEIASMHIGLEVKQMLFEELDAVEEFDGIWACASILHLPKSELASVLEKMVRAVKKGGYIYASFKYGRFEGERNERHFTDFTEETFRAFVDETPWVKDRLQIEQRWVSADVRPGREDEKWLNLICRRIDG